MSSKPNRARGRPRGSGKNDMPLLVQVAELMIKDPELRKTTAIKRVLARTNLKPGEMESTILRRLQHKWTVVGPSLLAEAQKHRTESSPRSSCSSTATLTASERMIEEVGRITAFQREIERMVNPIPLEVREALRFTETHQDHIRELQKVVNSTMFHEAVKEVNRMQDALRTWHRFPGF